MPAVAVEQGELSGRQRAGYACVYRGGGFWRRAVRVPAPGGCRLMFLFAHPECATQHPLELQQRPGPARQRVEMTRPRMRLSGPVLDSADPVGLARFYEQLLGWAITEREGPRPGYPPEDGWARVRLPAGDLKIEFQWDEHYAPPVWPSVAGEQQMMIHLDIAVEDLEAGVAWAVEAGASIAEHQPQAGVRVMLDPAGHPFCLFPGTV